jgi:hypothetical protein
MILPCSCSGGGGRCTASVLIPAIVLAVDFIISRYFQDSTEAGSIYDRKGDAGMRCFGVAGCCVAGCKNSTAPCVPWAFVTQGRMMSSLVDWLL